MNQALLLAVLASTLVAGCASQHKLTQPSGRWQAVNQAGFVPANAERFYKAVVQQAAAEAIAEQTAEQAQAAQTEQVTEPVSEPTQVSESDTQPTEAQ